MLPDSIATAVNAVLFSEDGRDGPPPTLAEAQGAVASAAANAAEPAATAIRIAAPGSKSAEAGGGGEEEEEDSAEPAEDVADWLVELLTAPAAMYAEAKAARRPLAAAASPTGSVDPHVEAGPVSTEGLAAAWKASPLYAAQMGAPPAAPPLALVGPWAQAQFGHAYAHAFHHHLALLVRRQVTLMLRNPLYLRARLMAAIIMSIVLGGLYYQRSIDQALTFFGTFLNMNMNLAMGNFQVRPSSSEGCREETGNQSVAHTLHSPFPPPISLAPCRRWPALWN